MRQRTRRITTWLCAAAMALAALWAHVVHPVAHGAHVGPLLVGQLHGDCAGRHAHGWLPPVTAADCRLCKAVGLLKAFAPPPPPAAALAALLPAGDLPFHSALPSLRSFLPLGERAPPGAA